MVKRLLQIKIDVGFNGKTSGGVPVDGAPPESLRRPTLAAVCPLANRPPRRTRKTTTGRGNGLPGVSGCANLNCRQSPLSGLLITSHKRGVTIMTAAGCPRPQTAAAMLVTGIMRWSAQRRELARNETLLKGRRLCNGVTGVSPGRWGMG